MFDRLSFVIPCYRSEGLVGGVISEIKEAMRDRRDYEIIAVNDCSPDNVLRELLRYANEDNRVKVIDLAKNMGKHAALMAGYSKVTGDVVVCVDDDGQCPIDRLWDLLEPLEKGWDISIARYGKKKQSAFKNFGSAVNARMAQYLIGKPEELQLSNFFAMKRFICDEITRYQNPYPYIDGLMLRSTSKLINVDMEERERVAGSSGYTFYKSLKLWINGFTAFSVMPLRIATLLGVFAAFIGFVCALVIVVRKILNPDVAAGYSSLMAAVLFIGGIIMMLLGLIGEYVGRIYISINNSPQYVIRRTINIDSCEKQEESITW